MAPDIEMNVNPNHGRESFVLQGYTVRIQEEMYGVAGELSHVHLDIVREGKEIPVVTFDYAFGRDSKDGVDPVGWGVQVHEARQGFKRSEGYESIMSTLAHRYAQYVFPRDLLWDIIICVREATFRWPCLSARANTEPFWDGREECLYRNREDGTGSNFHIS